jgi:phospholipase/lecithinase/hemolysin
MRSRHSFRPSAVDVLEERLVLSHAGPIHALAVHGAAAHVLPNVHNTPVALGPVGTLGDSYTDEYQFYPPDQSHARNWVEMLHALRAVNFGPFTLKSLGEPRDQGFSYNWARAGATSNDMIANQLPGLTSQVASGQIRYAWIFIGGNDFAFFLEGVQAGLIPPAAVPSTLLQVSTAVETNFTTAVDTLLAANPNVKLVVSTLPDITIQPIIQQLAKDPQVAPLINAVSQAIAHYNGLIHQIAAANPSRIAVVDLAGTANQLIQEGAATGGALPFGGTTITLTTGDDFHNFFLADGIHIGTVGQGIIADLFALAVDTHFNAGLFPPAPQEIVRYAAAIQRHTRHA